VFPAASCPFGAGILPISPECVHAAVTGLSDYGRCAFGSGPRRKPAGLLLPPRAAGQLYPRGMPYCRLQRV